MDEPSCSAGASTQARGSTGAAAASRTRACTGGRHPCRPTDRWYAGAVALPHAQLAQVRAVGTVFLRLRPWLVAPAIAAMWILLARAGAPRAQRAGFMLSSGLLLSLFVVEALRARRTLVSERWLVASLVVTTLGIGAGGVLTGGLQSGLTPLLLAPTVTAFAAFGRDRRSLRLFVLLAGVVAGLAALAPDVPFAALPTWLARTEVVLTLLLTAALLRASVAGLSDAHARAAASLERLRDDLRAEAEARTQTLERVGAQVAHELKNPLAAIKGLVQLVGAGASDDKSRQRLAVAAGEVERMEGILRDYLSFARPLAELRAEPVDLGRLCGDLLGIVEARAAAAGVGLAAVGPAGLTVHADARRLTLALLNLLGNALEATPRGGRIALTWQADAAAGARLEIADDGRGMSDEVLARVGTPYFTTRPGGTGLGVVLARATVEQHGGSLGFASAPGRGTKVTILLPKESHVTRAAGR